MNQLQEKMDNFFENADNTLNSVRRAAKILQWISALVIVFVLGLVMDTRIRVEQKVDKGEISSFKEKIQQDFLTKKDALTVYEFQHRYYLDIMSRDSIISKNAKYPIMIYNILQ